MDTFAAQLEGFADKTTEQLEEIVEGAVNDLLEACQTTAQGVTAGGVLIEGRIPVVSSDLVNSLASGKNGSAGTAGATSYTVLLAGFEAGDLLEFNWTMEYALRIEHGFNGTDKLGRTYEQPGWHFVGTNVANWDDYVQKRAALL